MFTDSPVSVGMGDQKGDTSFFLKSIFIFDGESLRIFGWTIIAIKHIFLFCLLPFLQLFVKKTLILDN